LSDDPHDRERFGRRMRGEAFGHPVWLPTPEDVILSKLRWSLIGKRPKDIEDILRILLVQQSRLDFEFLYQWRDVHGTRSLLDQIRAELPSVS
jgi:hypothetical protein